MKTLVLAVAQCLLPLAAHADGFFSQSTTGVDARLTGAGAEPRFRMGQAVMLSLDRGQQGLLVGGAITAAFGEPFSLLQVGPRAAWHFSFFNDRLRLGPVAGVAYAHRWSTVERVTGAIPGLTVTAGAEIIVRLAWVELFARPALFDGTVDEAGAELRYAASVGLTARL
ncbi:MAG: hypothetical protein KC613_20535 [Myxococcales bacterium]|nr:hypothetical protein [Myxococcales bacterium]MCB9526257.1 hypothetical protein [Myxococcales bacterium]